jgi:hypothetical protein
VRALAGTSDWRRNTLDLLGTAAILAIGTRSLPGDARWSWPELDPQALEQQLRSALPGLRIDAAVLPRQLGRARLSLLCHVPGRSGDTDVVVKLASVDEGLGNEARALELLTDRPLPGIATPSVLATGVLTPDITYLATDGLGLERQRPAIDEPLRSFEHDLADRLAAMPRPAGTPHDAVPVHGDLAPWNLRRTGRGLALFDWEASGWGVAGSDVEYYRRACAELHNVEPRTWITR